MTHQSPARDALLELYDALAQHQLRDAGAEVAAAIAHAVGTPLNVISGRAELIRHDPSNALAQVARIEEQVKKLATGLRQLVDYLAVPDSRAAQRGPGAQPTQPGAAEEALAVVEANTVVADVVALTEGLARANEVDVVADASALEGARVERWHALATLSSLVSCAIRQVGAHDRAAAPRAGSNGPNDAARIRIRGDVDNQGVVFELVVPGIARVEGWQLEHFQTRPDATECAEFHRTMSICAAVVRGHGGKLLVEAPSTEALVVRFSCRNESS